MANYDLARPAPFGAVTVYRTIESVSAVYSTIAGWNAARKTRQALASLSDEMLDDIGLNRGDVENF